MRIGELSKRTGLSRDTIRFYEKNGLIHSKAETSASNNYRDYADDCLVTIDLISQAKAAGMTLEDLTLFMAQLDRSPSDGFDGEKFLLDKILEVEERIARSKQFLNTLKATLQALKDAPLEHHYENQKR